MPNIVGFGSRAETTGERVDGPIERYVAILGDLVGSRDVPDRAELQRELKRILGRFEVEQPVRGLRRAGPEITAGDEFQLLLAAEVPGTAVMTYLTELTEDLPQTRIAFGVGLGALSTDLGGPVRELDGPCFHRARHALETAKRKGLWAMVAGLPSPLEEAANAILRLTGDIRATWTDRQLEMIRRRRRFPVQKDIAQQLAVSPSVVSEVLKAARHDAIQGAEHVVASLLNRATDPEGFAPWTAEASDE